MCKHCFLLFLANGSVQKRMRERGERNKGEGREEERKGEGDESQEKREKGGGGGAGAGARRSAEMKDSSDGTVSLGADTYEKQTSRRG